MDFTSVMCDAVREGKLELLKELLEHREVGEVLDLITTKTFGAAPLVIACRNGHYDVAEYLIEECGADVNQTGSVTFDSETIEDAPPLWCAAAAGHLALVKLLVKNGAQVNSTTKTNSTPLRAACFDGYYDIVKFLVNHGADIEMANGQGHTSLMIACYKGHIKIAAFLLALKADVNRKSIKGNTALHDSAENGSLEIVKLLMKHGARMDVDSYGMSPLLAAALTGHKHIVQYFINIPDAVTRKERIDALELLGATYVDKKRDMMEALKCWKQAMDLRYRGDGPILPKPSPSPAVPAYDFAQEVTDPAALNELLNDADEMRMQALLIRERILGPAHPDTGYYIRHRGAVYADSGLFGRCIELWNYAIDIQQRVLEPLNSMTQHALLGFTELFIFMVDKQINTAPVIQRNEILRVFEKAVLEVKLGKRMLDKLPPSERDPTALTRVLILALHLANLLTRDLPEENSEEFIKLHKAIAKLVRMNVKGRNGRDILHLIYSERGAVVGIGFKSLTYRFPSPHLLKALIRVGADVNARDNNDETVLHSAAIFDPSADLVNILLDAGAHIDAVGKLDKTFESLVWHKRFYESVYPIRYITLSCLAARVVKRTYNMRHVPKYFQAFVKMH